MASAMHDIEHARHIAALVRKLQQGRPEDDLLKSICTACRKMQEPGQKMFQCSACKAVRYCDAICAKRDWVGCETPYGKEEPHKKTCPILKESMKKLREMQAIAKQFPWARQQADGKFDFLIFRASKDLLGSGRGFGWWTERPCCNERTQYSWGFLLLEKKHLQERQGWKLPDDQIPWLDFAQSPRPPPELPVNFEHTWASYYAWRGLPIESPACLLLHWPLTVFRLLHILGFVPAEPTDTRRHLTVHLLGVEKEIDFIPVFGELALLLPNTDLDLVLFGPGVHAVLEKARSKPGCLASQQYVYTYIAPPKSGGGTIRIALSKSNEFWSGEDITRSSIPDAMVACNAGLSTYMTWKPVVIASRALAIPFAVTDYNEVSLHSDVNLLMKQLPLWAHLDSSRSKLHLGDEEWRRITSAPDASYDIRMNPFMHLGPRQEIHMHAPSALNGFELVITPKTPMKSDTSMS